MSIQTAIDERLVVEMWERQAFDLAALSQVKLTVVFRGVPSDAGGPDYQDAILSQSDGSLLEGDIEFHVRSSDWYRHGHANDPRYNAVILHVVWQDDAVCTVRADECIVPVIELSACSPKKISCLRAERPALAPHPCVAEFSALSPAELVGQVAQLGWMRFQEREDRFCAELELASPDQVLYGALLEGMGYASNRQTFLELAEAIPVAWLLTLPPELRTAALLDAAGLGPPCGVEVPARLPPGSWRLSRLRPGNHPAVRIRGTVCLLGRLGVSPADSLVAAVAKAQKPADLRTCLMARVGGAACVGQGRADELAASVVLPFVAAADPSVAGVRALYERYASPPSTRWTRVMQDLFERAGHEFPVRTALEHQGLHLLYTRFCRKEGANGCPVCGHATTTLRGRQNVCR